MGRTLLQSKIQNLKSKIAVPDTILKTRLPGGLLLLTEQMPHVRSVSLGVWLKTGARYESGEQLGVCHFLEHMLFKGSPSRSAEQIAKAVDALGGNLDAFTSKDTICFSAKVLDEHLPAILDIMADVVQNPAFPEVELEREKRVILEEIKMVEDTPDDLVHELFFERLWKDHGLGHPILGTRRAVRDMSRSTVVEYFRKYFVSENLLVSAAGNLDHDALAREVRLRFEGLTTGRIADDDKPPQINPGVVLRNKKELEQVHVCIGIPAYAIGHPDRWAAYVLNVILGAGMSSRLFLNIRERRGLAYSVFSSITPYRDAGALTVYAGTALDNVDEVIGLILKEFTALKAQPLAPEELALAKSHLKGNLMLSLESTTSRMTNLAHQELYFGRFFNLDQIVELIEAVTAEQVRRVAGELFVADTLTACVIGPLEGWKLKKEQLVC